MAEHSNAKQSIYSDLEPENEYSQPEVVDHSDRGSISGGSDHGSEGHRNGSDGHHDDDHGARDRDQSDREDDLSDREDRKSDRGDHDLVDGRSDRSHSIHDREGSLHDSDDGARDRHDDHHDHGGDLYDALDEMEDLVAQAEAEQTYSNADQDRKSDGSHSDGEGGEGHGGRAVRPKSLEGARANGSDDEEAIYDEVQERHSDSEGSEKGEQVRGHGRHSDNLYDDTRDGHPRENGHQRRESHDSDEENRRTSVDGGYKRQTSSNAPTSSGKFVLRTSRKADALHVLRHIRDSSSAEDNPEMDELVTILRTTDHKSKHEEVLDEEKQKEKIKSFLTSKLIHKFEQGIEDGFNENHDDHSKGETTKIPDRHNTTVVKTTVVKTTVTSPVSPKSPGIPKSPTTAVAVSGSSVASDVSRNSSSSSLSSASQTHQKSVTYESQVSNPGITKSSTTTVTSLHVTVTPSRHPTNELPKTPEDSNAVPAWKAEIEMRKKTKSHVPTQKPKEPMKLSEVPEWKKQLQEKNKMKKLSSNDEPDITLARVTTVEMGRLKHEMVITHGGRGDTLPEWARLADEKQKTISH